MIQIKYRKIGNGNKIVLIMHEWMGDCSNYDASIPYLNISDFTYYFIDFRGYGLSKELDGDFNLEEMTNDIKTIIRNENLEKFTLIGHSMSSLVVQKLSLDLKEQVLKQILITPIPPTGIKMKEEAKEKLLLNVKNENGVIEQVVEGASKRYNDVWKDYRKNIGNKCSTTKAKLGYMNMYLSNDFSKEIKGLNIPTKVIVGKYDLPAFHKNSVHKEFVKYYPDFEIIECQESGHYPMIECPVYFANKIENFINQ